MEVPLRLGAVARGLGRYMGGMAIKRVKQLQHGVAGLLPAPAEVEEAAPVSVG